MQGCWVHIEAAHRRSAPDAALRHCHLDRLATHVRHDVTAQMHAVRQVVEREACLDKCAKDRDGLPSHDSAAHLGRIEGVVPKVGTHVEHQPAIGAALRRRSRTAHQRSSEVLRGPQRSSEVIRGHQRSSEAIRGPQRSSEVLRGHQRSSEVLRGPQRSSEVLRGHQRSSEVIRGHQRSSEAIRGRQRSSEVIRGHQRPSEAIRGHQRPSEAIRGNQR